MQETCRTPDPRRAVRTGGERIRNRIAMLAAVAALSGAASLAAPSPARAWLPAPRWDDAAHGRLVDVSIEVDGRDVPLYPSPRWDGRRYFQAFRGREYAVTLHNTTGERIGVLVAVDGLNVITGRRSALASGEAMYVLDPWGSATIRGWRTSLDDIRRFVFVDEERSYATRTGQASGDLGWIRVLAFREARPIAFREPRFRPDTRDEPAPPAPDARPFDGGAQRDNAAPETARKQAQGFVGPSRAFTDEAPSNPGTGWGRGGYDPVREVDFVAQARPLDRIVLRYEYADGLRALGIEPWDGRDRTWQRDRGELGFAQPPRW